MEYLAKRQKHPEIDMLGWVTEIQRTRMRGGGRYSGNRYIKQILATLYAGLSTGRSSKSYKQVNSRIGLYNSGSRGY
jgi:hypothetical protein